MLLSDNEDECLPSVECQQAQEACRDLAEAAAFLDEAIVQADRRQEFTDQKLWARYINVQSAAGRLTQAMIEYTDPDPGTEPL